MLLNDGVFIIYVPRKLKFSCSEFTKYDTEIFVTLPDNSWGFFAQNIETIIEDFSCKKERLRIGILNKSLSEDIVIEKGKVPRILLSKQAKNLM